MGRRAERKQVVRPKDWAGAGGRRRLGISTPTYAGTPPSSWGRPCRWTAAHNPAGQRQRRRSWVVLEGGSGLGVDDDADDACQVCSALTCGGFPQGLRRLDGFGDRRRPGACMVGGKEK